jgi:tRNA(Ile)-lysidine synthase
MLINRIKKTINKYALLNTGDHVVVAVSGGPDSVCLLSVLNDIAKDFNLSLHVAHLDHMFRGRESAAEAEFVSALAGKFALPATIRAIDVPAYCRERGLSVQAGAREVRYDFLSRVAKESGASRIATGHTANDQAETVIMRLMRGSGLSSLSAIPPRRGIIIRPLLEATRDDVLGYLRSRGLDFVSDSSNEKQLYTRNRIRSVLLPVLARFNPRIVQTLAAEAAILKDEDEAADACLQNITGGVMEQVGGRVLLQRGPFGALHRAFKRRLLIKAVHAATSGSVTLSFAQVDEALEFMARAQTGKSMHVQAGLTIGREYDAFIVAFPEKRESFSYPLAVPGVTSIPDLALTVETTVRIGTEQASAGAHPEDAAQENYLWQALFDYDKIVGNIAVRNRLPGDWFCPSGMKGKHKKLQDFLVDARVAQSRRDAIPLLVSGEDIFWVAGLRSDDRFLPGPETTRLLVVRIKQQAGDDFSAAFQQQQDYDH